MNTDPSTKTKHIFIVEDHPLFRGMLAQLINNEPDMLAQLINNEPDMLVSGDADNITDALTMIQQTQPDAAIVDISLQGPSGLELIKSLTAHNSQIPLLVLSMHSEKLYAERVIRAGAKGYVSKLASPFEVIKALNKVLNGQIYLSEQVTELILERLGQGGQTPECLGVDGLSDREIEVFQLIGRGLNSRECAEQLNLGLSTVDSYRARIKQKLAIKNAAELYQRAAQWLVENKL